MIWNMYDFFTLYAEVDNWEWNGKLEDPSDSLKNPLDLWIVSRVHQLSQEVEASMNRYDIPSALKPVLPFIDDASNWYVRRSRRRFWKSGDDTDKNDAYKTLHYVLVRLSMVMAPFTPFLAEELYRLLTEGESVHLLDWPKTGKIDQKLVKEMAEVRESITQGLAQRAAASIKVRQPLANATVSPEVPERFYDVIAEELNVKEVTPSPSPSSSPGTDENPLDATTIDTHITEELREEGIMRELVRLVQNARKEAGLNVEDRICLLIETESPEIQAAIDAHKDTIVSETLTEEYGDVPVDSYVSSAKVEGLEVRIALAKR